MYIYCYKACSNFCEKILVPISSYNFHTPCLLDHCLMLQVFMDILKHSLTDIHVTQFACTHYTTGMAKANTTILTAVWSLTWFVNYWQLKYNKMADLKIYINILAACEGKQIYSHWTSCCVLNTCLLIRSAGLGVTVMTKVNTSFWWYLQLRQANFTTDNRVF